MHMYIRVSQAQGVLGDLKTALYLGVSPPAMFRAQCLGALIGVAASATTFIVILQERAQLHPP